MTKNHLKRIRAPKTWNVQRKKTKFIARPKPGGQPLTYTIPLSVLLIENLKIFHKGKELTYALNNKDILVNGVARTHGRFPVGLLDTVSIPKLDRHVRLVINTNSKLMPVTIEKGASAKRVSKITLKKTGPKGKVQIGTIDGRTLLVDNASPYKTNDSLVLELPSQKVLTHLPFEKGATGFIYKGRHTGMVITIEGITDGNVTFMDKGHQHETKKDYIIIIGKELPELHHLSP